MWRFVERLGETGPYLVLVDSVKAPTDLAFTNIPSEWLFDSGTGDWTYNNGAVEVFMRIIRESGKRITERGFETTLFAAFRIRPERPDTIPGGATP